MGRTLDLHAARTTVCARGAAAGIPVDQMMAFVGHRDIRTAMKHYRDPNATNTQAIAARLAGVPEACGARGGAHGEAASASYGGEATGGTDACVRTGIRAASSTAARPQPTQPERRERQELPGNYTGFHFRAKSKTIVSSPELAGVSPELLAL